PRHRRDEQRGRGERDDALHPADGRAQVADRGRAPQADGEHGLADDVGHLEPLDLTVGAGRLEHEGRVVDGHVRNDESGNRDVGTSDRRMLRLPTSSTNSAKFDAAPVSVSTPMITPTMAHAMPTAMACRAPSTRLARIVSIVARPPRRNSTMTSSAPMTARMG